MRIVADANIPYLDETAGRHAEIVRVDGRSVTPADLSSADALLVRSVTNVNATLLANSPVRFVGSTTIGSDHLDTDWLDAEGIAWANAPGCNADAAAQYTLAMMLLACRRLGRDPSEQTVGIIGRGNVGSRLASLLDAFGIKNEACDPPLAESGESGLLSLEEVLAMPVVSLHVPLTRNGLWPTWQMLDRDQLAQLPAGGLLVNAARGNVVAGDALSDALAVGRLHAALDVWPSEPDIPLELLERVTVGTPHVAGYSEDGKLAGSRMIYQAMCAEFNLDPVPGPTLTPVNLTLEPELLPDCRKRLEHAVLQVCPVERDHGALLETSASLTRPRDFDGLRRDYPPRREFGATRLSKSHDCTTLATALGFLPAA